MTLTEPEPGRHRATFALGTDPDTYAHAAALIARVRNWQGSEVYLGPIPVSPVIAKDLAWCAGDQLHRHGECRFGYYWNIPARCLRCPMFDQDRAEQLAGEGPAPVLLEFELAPTSRGCCEGTSALNGNRRSRTPCRRNGKGSDPPSPPHRAAVGLPGGPISESGTGPAAASSPKEQSARRTT